MIKHKIHDLSNKYVTDLLVSGLMGAVESPENYSPFYSRRNSNLFYILENGRYKDGAYYVLEENGKYVASAGWNRYDDNTALVLTRSYVSKEYRSSFVMGNLILPEMLDQCSNYDNVWMTCNGSNKVIYDWISRIQRTTDSAIIDMWPPIYSRFEPIGIKHVYHTDQYVMQLKR